ncbi:hypothetical protein K449DRAFT_445244 [Hypoxylon sp. EC38]|nr:hypothetical protein K449DRAFT_445244 [Hypoxylon sp. EC38]
MDMIVEYHPGLEGQISVDVKDRAGDDIFSFEGRSDDVLKFVHFLQLVRRNGTTITIPVPPNLSRQPSAQYHSQRDSIYLNEQPPENPYQPNGSRVFEPNLSCIMQPKLYDPLPLQDDPHFLSGARLKDRMSIDGLVPQAIYFKFRSETDEAVLRINPREFTATSHVLDGGSYSGIVREFKVAGGQSVSFSGSGTVIDDHHVMTVGHVIWSRKYGPAVSVTIERDSRATRDEYPVDSCTVHFMWAEEFSEPNDFAVLRVSKRFHDGIKRMNYKRTPTTMAPLSANILGFSSDMPMAGDGEWLGHLCHSPSQVEYAPDTDPLLKHYGDTEKGASGGPIVHCETTIALHKGTYRDKLANKAIPIDCHGNDINNFIQAIAFMTRGELVTESRIIRGGEFTLDGLEDSVAAWFCWQEGSGRR